jgi:hypothetical protein
MGIEKKLVKFGKYVGKNIGKYSTLGSLIGASLLSSNAKAEINMKDVLDAVLDNYKPAVTQQYEAPNKSKEGLEYKVEKEWKPYAECFFQGPRFDEDEVLDSFERRDEQGNILFTTREEFRSGANAYTECEGVLTINGAAGTSDSFGMDKREGPQRLTACFDPISLKAGEGSIGIELTNNNPDDNRGIYVAIFHTDSPEAPMQSAIYAGIYADGLDYSLTPIPYLGEERLRMTKDNTGFILVEIGAGGVWSPILASDVLAGNSCRPLVNPKFDSNSWKPKMTAGSTMAAGLTFEAPRLPCDIDWNGTVNSLDVQLTVNAALGYDISPYNADVNEDGKVDAVDVQSGINAVLGINY